MAIIADNTGTTLDHLETWTFRRMDPAIRWTTQQRNSICRRCANYKGHQSRLFIRCDQTLVSLAGGRGLKQLWEITNAVA